MLHNYLLLKDEIITIVHLKISRLLNIAGINVLQKVKRNLVFDKILNCLSCTHKKGMHSIENISNIYKLSASNYTSSDGAMPVLVESFPLQTDYASYVKVVFRSGYSCEDHF
mmetsp:Transcript_44223/g.65033  ORF Transcript_44223/g.65033 Transcript_44223/m.65033 type:complete len:112 (-) Transcript_44223:3772-4107(-)